MKPPGNFLEYTWFPGDSLISENCQYQYYRSISSSSLPNICGLSQIGGTCVNISRYLTGFLRAKWVIIVNLGREAYLDFGHPLIWITKKKKNNHPYWTQNPPNVPFQFLILSVKIYVKMQQQPSAGIFPAVPGTSTPAWLLVLAHHYLNLP